MESSSKKRKIDSEPSKKSKKLKCMCCNKKIKLKAFYFKCKCGKMFCQKCLSPEVHNCTFNYKKEGEESIRDNNPPIIADKIENRI